MHWFDQLLRSWERDHPGRKMSIRKLADSAGVNQVTVQRFKRGKSVSTDTLSRIALVFEVSSGELLNMQQSYTDT